MINLDDIRRDRVRAALGPEGCAITNRSAIHNLYLALERGFLVVTRDNKYQRPTTRIVWDIHCAHSRTPCVVAVCSPVRAVVYWKLSWQLLLLPERLEPLMDIMVGAMIQKKTGAYGHTFASVVVKTEDGEMLARMVHDYLQEHVVKIVD